MARVDDALAELARRFELGTDAVECLRKLLRLGSTDPVAPPTVRAPAGILDDHIADSLVALELPVVRRAVSIADLGSGAGFPGLPLAVALPGAAVALVESSARKCEFIGRAVAVCALTNTSIVHARAERWTDGIGSSDL